MPSFLIQYKTPIISSLIVISGIILYFIFGTSQPQEASIQPIQTIQEPQSTIEKEGSKVEPQQLVSTAVIVDVKGAVKKPGIYELDPSSRVMDAISLAGGYIATADRNGINLAAKLQDEMVIYVPKKGEQKDNPLTHSPANSPTGQQSASSGETQQVVNINTADETQLQTLSGIGPSKAKAIITYRTETGLFQTIEDLKKVTGFGEKTFERLQSSITVQ